MLHHPAGISTNSGSPASDPFPAHLVHVATLKYDTRPSSRGLNYWRGFFAVGVFIEARDEILYCHSFCLC